MFPAETQIKHEVRNEDSFIIGIVIERGKGISSVLLFLVYFIVSYAREREREREMDLLTDNLFQFPHLVKSAKKKECLAIRMFLHHFELKISRQLFGYIGEKNLA